MASGGGDAGVWRSGNEIMLMDWMHGLDAWRRAGLDVIQQIILFS